MFSTFRSYPLAITIRSRSSTWHTGTTCGHLPMRCVPRCPTRASAMNTASAGVSSRSTSFLPAGVGLLADLLDDLGVRERRHIPERVPPRDVAQQPPHDLARPCL